MIDILTLTPCCTSSSCLKQTLQYFYVTTLFFSAQDDAASLLVFSAYAGPTSTVKEGHALKRIALNPVLPVYGGMGVFSLSVSSWLK